MIRSTAIMIVAAFVAAATLGCAADTAEPTLHVLERGAFKGRIRVVSNDALLSVNHRTSLGPEIVVYAEGEVDFGSVSDDGHE